MSRSASEDDSVAFVRSQLNQLGFNEENGFIIEGQKTSDKEIMKTLEKASKNKTRRHGRPDLFIRKIGDPRWVVVFEIKPSVSQHSSGVHKVEPILEIDKNKLDYAVEGVLWYASYIKSVRNVIAIAFSGNRDANQVSVFKWQRGHDDWEPIRYIGRIGTDVEELLDSTSLYEHAEFKLSEVRSAQVAAGMNIDKSEKFLSGSTNQRGTGITMDTTPFKTMLVQGLMMALRDENFRTNYRDWQVEDLPDRVVEAMRTVVSNDADISEPSGGEEE